MAFAALHCTPWNGIFPADIVRNLWRAASVVAVPGYLYAWTTDPPYLRHTIPAFFLTSYTAARIYLIVEAFISLRAQPAAVYDDAEWAKFLPYF